MGIMVNLNAEGNENKKTLRFKMKSNESEAGILGETRNPASCFHRLRLDLKQDDLARQDLLVIELGEVRKMLQEGFMRTN